ncbi:hypothetical protein V3C99_003579 [Haemonchus contortus]
MLTDALDSLPSGRGIVKGDSSTRRLQLPLVTNARSANSTHSAPHLPFPSSPPVIGLLRRRRWWRRMLRRNVSMSKSMRIIKYFDIDSSSS